jgi:hypothetical protein
MNILSLIFLVVVSWLGLSALFADENMDSL